MVRSALLLWQPQAEQVVRVETTLNEPLPTIMGNVTQLQQVVINLEQRLDATPAGGTIAVSTRSLGEPLSTWRWRSGIRGPASRRSISPRSSIHFLPPSLLGKARGLGCRCALASYKDQGTIIVDSRDGRGSTFMVILPVIPRVELSRRAHRMLQPALTASQDEGVC